VRDRHLKFHDDRDNLGVDAADVSNAPAGHDIEYDDQHRIVGWGLTFNPTPHTYIAATAVISIPGSEEIDTTRVRTSTCNPGRFFATAESAKGWLAQHPDGVVLPVAEAYPQLRAMSSRLLDLPETPSP
jgi:alkylmercury lyase